MMLFTICIVVLSLAVAPVVCKVSGLMLLDFIHYMEHNEARPGSGAERSDLVTAAKWATGIALVSSVTIALFGNSYAAIAAALLGGLVPTAGLALIWSVFYMTDEGRYVIADHAWRAWESIDRFYAEGKRRCKAKFGGSSN